MDGKPLYGRDEDGRLVTSEDNGSTWKELRRGTGEDGNSYVLWKTGWVQPHELPGPDKRVLRDLPEPRFKTAQEMADAPKALEESKKGLVLEVPKNIARKWATPTDRPPDVPADVPKDDLDEMFWQRRGLFDKIFKDPKRAGKTYLRQADTAFSKTKRDSLGGKTVKQAVEPTSIGDAAETVGSLVKGLALGTPTALARKLAAEVPGYSLDFGGAMAGGMLRFPEIYHGAMAGSEEPGSRGKAEHLTAAKDWLDTAREATSYGNKWRQIMDEVLPGKDLAATSPLQPVAEGAAEAAPAVLAMLAGNKTAGGRKLLNALMTAKSAAEGVNIGTEAGLSPADTAKLALGRSTIRAIETRLPVSNIVHKSLGGGTKASITGSLADAGIFNTMRNAQTDDFLRPVTGQRTDKDEGFWQNAIMDFGLRTLLHQNPDVAKSNKARLEGIEGNVTKTAGEAELDKLRNFLGAVRNVREGMAVKAYRKERTGAKPLTKMSDEFNVQLRKAEASAPEPGNVSPLKALGDVPAPGDFSDPFTQLRTTLGEDLKIPRVQPKGWLEGIFGQPAKRPDLGLQKEIESSRYGRQSDVDVAASWADTVKKKYGLKQADLDAIENWLGAAQTNYELGITDLHSGPMPKGGVPLPDLTPNQHAALVERAGVAGGATRDYAYKQAMTAATRLVDAGVPIEDIRKAFNTGKLNTAKIKKNPRALAQILKVGEQIPDQPFYNPRVFEGGEPPQLPTGGSAAKSKSVHEISRMFNTLVDEDGNRIFSIKSKGGKYVPVGMVDDPDTGEKVFNSLGPAIPPDDIKGGKYKVVTSTPEEVMTNTGKNLNLDPLVNLGASRVDMRNAARGKAWQTALVNDPELVGEHGAAFPGRPDVAMDDPTVQRSQSAIFDRDSGKIRPGAGFRGDVTNVLEAFFGKERLGKASKLGSAANKIQDLYTRLTLANPIVHGGNVVEHPMKAYGLKNLMGEDPAADQALLTSAYQMIHERHPLYQAYIQSGGRDLSLARRAESGYKTLHGDTKGEGMSRLLGGEGDPMSRTSVLGLDNVSDEVIWKPDAAMRFALWMKQVENGVDPRRAHKEVADTQPNYSIPVNLVNDPSGNSPVNKGWQFLTGMRNETPDQAAFAKLFRPMFHRYRHNSIASTLNTGKDISNLDPKGLDKVAMLAALYQGPYKGLGEMYSQAAGDDDNRFDMREPGTNHYLKIMADLKNGALSTSEAIDRLYTPPPLARAAVGIGFSRDPATGRSLHNEKLPFLAESFLPQGYAISNLVSTHDPAKFFGSNLLMRPEKTTAEKIASFTKGQQTLGSSAFGEDLLDQIKGAHAKSAAGESMRRAIKENDQDALREILQAGDVNLAGKSLKNARLQQELPREMVLAQKIESLDANSAMDVFEKMNDMEKIAAYRVMVNKFTRGGTPNELRAKEAMIPTLKKMYAEAIDNMENGMYARQYPMFFRNQTKPEKPDGNR